jgi:hypothetical protein
LSLDSGFCNRSGHVCFSAIQKPIDLNAINSEPPCKLGLASFPINRGPQHLNNVTFLKDHRGPGQFGDKRLVLTFSRHPTVDGFARCHRLSALPILLGLARHCGTK